MTASLSLGDPPPGAAGTTPWGQAPHRADQLDRAPDLLVVGAGLAGLAVAASAVEAGLGSVQVVDRSRIAGAASGRNAGALIPDVHALSVGPDEAGLGRRGLVLHRALARRTGIPLRRLAWFAATSTMPPADRLRASGARWLGTPAEVAEATDGHLQAASGVLVPDQAATDPVAVATALAAGPRVTTGIVVHRLDLDGTLRVETSAGRIRPGAVVVATGAAPSDWLPSSRQWMTGHLAMTTPVDVPTDLGSSAGIVVVPRGDGRLLVGGTRDGEHLDGDVDPVVVDDIARQLADLVPAAADVGFERVWTGQRPVVDDDLPLVAPLSDHAAVIAGLYHSGLVTCLAIAEGVVAWLEDGTWPDSLLAFGRRP